MAQSLCSINNTIPVAKSSVSSKNSVNGQCYYHPRSNELGLIRLKSNRNGIKAMKAERRDNLDHLQRPAGLKRRDVTPTPLGLWDRFPTARTVQQMMETMDRVMDDPAAFNTRWTAPPPNNGTAYAKGRTPWDIKEGEAEYKLRFDMPGMTKNDVKMWVEENMLVIKAEKVAKPKDGQENGELVEDEGDWPAKSFGTYSSRIALPEHVEFEKIKAEVKGGVLYITIPKPVHKSKVYDINVE